MELTTTIRIAIRNIGRHAIRSTLALTGIVVGVTAVVAMVSIGNGARLRVQTVLSTYDPSQLSVYALPPSEDDFSEPPVLGNQLTLEDYKAIRSINSVAQASPMIVFGPKQAAARNGRTKLLILGVDVEGPTLLGRRLIVGNLFADSDVRRAGSVCLLTVTSTRKLFGETPAIGKVVLVDSVPFVVIGIVSDNSRLTVNAGPLGDDPAVFVPYTSFIRRISRNEALQIRLRSNDVEQLEPLKQAIRGLLEERRGRRSVRFSIAGEIETVETYVQGEKTVTNLLAAIGALSLFVGGIGVMNVMLVSVTERTREIGVRLAVGTRASDLLRQFLIEAVLLTAIGGTIGIIFGSGLSVLITYINGWPTQIAISTVFVALFCSGTVGIAAGYYPARHAARLDPVASLRSD